MAKKHNVVACTKTQKKCERRALEIIWRKSGHFLRQSYTVWLMIIMSEDEVEISTTCNDTGSNSGGNKGVNGNVLWK